MAQMQNAQAVAFQLEKVRDKFPLLSSGFVFERQLLFQASYNSEAFLRELATPDLE
jgi:hypothetical protein